MTATSDAVTTDDWQTAVLQAVSGDVIVEGTKNCEGVYNYPSGPFAFSAGTVTLVYPDTTSGLTTPFAVGTVGDLKDWVRRNGGTFNLDTYPGITLGTEMIVMDDHFGLSSNSGSDYSNDYWVLTVQDPAFWPRRWPRTKRRRAKPP